MVRRLEHHNNKDRSENAPIFQLSNDDLALIN
jgi:hypothetical protein